MQYEIMGDSLPSVSINLDRGEGMYTQSGGMAWMTKEIKMQTNTKGGLFRGLARKLSGESLFLATYTATADDQIIGFSSSFPGHILDLQLTGGSIIVQKTAFLCAEPTINLSPHLVKGIGRGLFGGEGFIQQKLSGYGMVFLEIDGDLMDFELAHGQTIRVSTGHVAAYESSVDYNIERVTGVKNFMFGGEGMFHTTLTGPGRVWVQTIPLAQFASRLAPFLGGSRRRFRKKEE